MQKFKLNYILCLVFVLILCPFSIFAEDPEQGEVIIQTDETYNDHEVIEACEVGNMVKLDIGSFDTAYINNNFDVNSNINGYVYFECQTTNDIKLAYYGINETIYNDDTSLFTDAQIDALRRLNYDNDLFIYYIVDTGAILYSYNISSVANNYTTVNLSDYYFMNTSGISSYQNSPINNFNINANYYYVYYFKYNDNLIYNGLPESITDYIFFEDIASVYVNFIYDNYFSELASWITGSQDFIGSSDIRVIGGMECEVGAEYSARCDYYKFNGAYEGDDVFYSNYLRIDMPTITITAPTHNFSFDRYFNGHYEIMITFDDDYQGYMEFNLGGDTKRFYINGSELKFNYTPSSLYTSNNSNSVNQYELSIVGYELKRKIDPIVNPVEDDQKESVSKNDTQNAELDSVISEYNEIEGQFKDNLDTSLNDIDLSFGFGSITDFSTSANFVRSQFNNLTDNPFGSLVGFSLAVGLALLIMGRRL